MSDRAREKGRDRGRERERARERESESARMSVSRGTPASRVPVAERVLVSSRTTPPEVLPTTLHAAHGNARNTGSSQHYRRVTLHDTTVLSTLPLQHTIPSRHFPLPELYTSNITWYYFYIYPGFRTQHRALSQNHTSPHPIHHIKRYFLYFSGTLAHAKVRCLLL